MALSANALVSLDEVKEFYFPDKEKSKSQDDDLLEHLIDMKTDQFETYCGVDSFHDATHVEYVSSIGGNAIFVKNNPINSVISIYDDQDWTWDADSLIDSTDYRISGGRYILLKYYIGAGHDNIKITYNGGYTTIPGDLKLACVREVIREFKHRQDFDVISKSLEDGSVTYEATSLLPATKQTIEKYKRVLVGG